ncbi:hypothetical protein NESM_000710700 [Novymonas esmeraldas]|uniref:Uncharacterized protein n=1 Tax=Novymonas esmeraldas TaxID=1808958 RepID=A0AAW0EVQ8_9TRYP
MSTSDVDQGRSHAAAMHGAQLTTTMHVSSRKPGALSVGELRTAMQQHLRSTGALRELKTQLRGMVLTELLQQPKTARMLVHGTAQSVPPSSPDGVRHLEDRKTAASGSPAAPGIVPVTGRSDHTLQTWSCGLADALVENHLRRTRRAMTLSIFSTEAEVPPFTTTGAPSEEEQYLLHLFQQTEPGAAAAAEPEDDILTPSPSRSAKSVLQRLVENCVARHGLASSAASGQARHLHSCSTQTDAADSADGASNLLNSLECRLAAVDAKYALTFAQLKRGGAAGEQCISLRAEVERRLQQYKTDMHAQLRVEYEQKYNSFTRVKLQEARDSAEERYRVFTQHKTEELAEMERSVLVRMEQERQRLKAAWEDVHVQRAELERRQRDTATMLAERDTAQQRSDAELHSWREKARVLQLQCAKWEELCGTRLMELDGARSREGRRVEDIRRLQAEHAAELQLKEEEIGRLRFRLRLVSREGGTMHTAGDAGHAGAAEAGSGATAAAAAAAAAPCASNRPTAAAPVDPRHLYGLLLRTEEMQRTALVQQQQQQERWDAAWVAASAAGPASTPAPATALDASLTAGLVRTPPPTSGAARDAASPPATPVARTPAVAAAPAEVENVARAAAPSSSSERSASAAAPPAAAALRNSTSASASSTTPSSVSSAARAATQQQQRRTGAADPSTSTSTQKTTSPSSSGTASSASATPPAQRGVEDAHPIDDVAPRRTSDAAALLAAAAVEEQSGRAEVQSEEASARNGIVWLEGNRRELLVLELRRRGGDGDDGSTASSRSGGGSSSGGGVVAPWKRAGAVGSGAALGSRAADVVFEDSFDSDDDALIRDSDEDDSEF